MPSTFFKGEEPMFADKEGMILLHVAGEQPDPSIIPALVDLDIDVNVRGGKKARMSFMLAAESGPP